MKIVKRDHHSRFWYLDEYTYTHCSTDFWISCTSRFNAGFRIIEIIWEGVYSLFVTLAGGSNPVGPNPNPLPNPAGQN